MAAMAAMAALVDRAGDDTNFDTKTKPNPKMLKPRPRWWDYFASEYYTIIADALLDRAEYCERAKREGKEMGPWWSVNADVDPIDGPDWNERDEVVCTGETHKPTVLFVGLWMSPVQDQRCARLVARITDPRTLNARDEESRSALILAAAFGYVQTTQALLNRAPLEVDIDGTCMWCFSKRCPQQIAKLINEARVRCFEYSQNISTFLYQSHKIPKELADLICQYVDKPVILKECCGGVLCFKKNTNSESTSVPKDSPKAAPKAEPKVEPKAEPKALPTTEPKAAPVTLLAQS